MAVWWCRFLGRLHHLFFKERRIQNMKTITIAMICHSINAAYCQSLGDDSQPIWDDAPEWQKQSIIAGVEMHIANPDATPEQSHESWYKQKEAEGWKYGEVKDVEKKEHPCFLPYEELPQAQKSKDYLFRATVHLMKDLPDSEDYFALSAEVVSQRQKLEQQKNIAITTAAPAMIATTQQVGIAIQYVGNKSLFKDHLYNSTLTFTTGQVRKVTSDLAAKFLKHPEFKLYEGAETLSDANQVDDTEEILTNAKTEQEKQELEQTKLLDEIDIVNRMTTKKSVIEYVKSRYQQDLSDKDNLAALKEQATKLVHEFGVV